MKRILTYLLLPGLLALSGACSEAPEGDSDRTGSLQMEITTTRSETDGSYLPEEHLVVRIYDSRDNLLRKYTSAENIPARLSLLAGEYRVAVEAGKAADASFTERSYRGEETFAVEAGKVTPVKVVCKLRSTVVQVRFDETVVSNFAAGYFTRVAVCAPYDDDDVLEGRVPSLKYTADAAGYFSLPENTSAMSWRFEGTHTERGEIVQTGQITGPSDGSGLKPGGKYTLTFRFSKDKPGYIEAVLIEVDPSTDDRDDTIIFSPDPTVEGAGFDAKALMRYTGGDKTFNIATVAAMQRVTLTVDGTEYSLFDAENPDLPAVEGILARQQSSQQLTVTLTDAFFAAAAAGDHTLSFHVLDNDKGELTAETPLRMQGLLPVTESDYDLWSKTLTLRAVSFDETSTVFTLDAGNGDTQELSGIQGTNDCYTAVFGPEWESSVNRHGQTVYSIREGTGIQVGMNYTYTVAYAGNTIQGTISTPGPDDADRQIAEQFLIPDGDMEDETLPCFTETGSSNSNFWGSGNNNNAESLCKPDVYDGNRFAKLQSVAAGMVTFYSLAAGNLFTGTFTMKNMTGTVSFGQKYNYAARPAALRVNYHAKIGTVDYNLANGPLAKGEQDKARIFVAVVDWSSRHKVASTYSMTGSSSCSGSWDPEKDMYGGNDATKNEGRIIGYASMWIETSTDGDVLISSDDALKLYWYDTQTDAPTGNYTLVISCSANAYGDFFNGCSTNHLHVDDFRWVY